MNNIKIGVVGLGYVGLPLARLFATKYEVVGFDINNERVRALTSGVDSTLEVSNDDLIAVLKKEESDENGLLFTTSIESISNCNYYIITVPTQVDKNKH